MRQVAQVMQGYDASDDYSRMHPQNVPSQFSKGKIAIPDTLEFYGDAETEKVFQLAITRAQSLGYTVEPIDFTPFQQLAAALYNRSWVAERTSAVEKWCNASRPIRSLVKSLRRQTGSVRSMSCRMNMNAPA